MLVRFQVSIGFLWYFTAITAGVSDDRCIQVVAGEHGGIAARLADSLFTCTITIESNKNTILTLQAFMLNKKLLV